MRNVRRLTVLFACTTALASAMALPAAQARDTRTAPVAAAGVAVHGGTLNVLSPSDADYLDPNITYFSVGYAFARTFSRQLYSWSADRGQTMTTMPDLATGQPVVTHDGTRYRVRIRAGALWDTNPVRQVRAADVVRGVEISCNPAQPSGARSSYVALIVGLRSYCHEFVRTQPTAQSIRHFVRTHHVRGLRVPPGHPRTIVFRLRHRASYFRDMLALPAMSPRPRETLDFVPGSTQQAQHLISDGPYEISEYRPTRRLVLQRNPSWDPATDPLRAAYVDRIVVTMNDDAYSAVPAIRSGDSSADLFLGPLPADLAQRRRQAADPRLVVRSSVTTNPYLLFNTASPNNSGALGKKRVRQALSYALDRRHLLHDVGPHWLTPALTHILPRQILGSEDFDLYPHDRSKARSLLRAAGEPHPTLKFLYRSSSPTSKKMFSTVQRDLGRIGVKVVGVPTHDADYYTKYLQNRRASRHGWWDVATTGWGPDWYDNGALSVLHPLFSSTEFPWKGFNYGLFSNPPVDRLIRRAAHAPRDRAAARWHRADLAVMSQAPIYPITDPNDATYHASQVRHYVYLPQFRTADFTNVWLDPTRR